jgi:hypothetical protein
MCSLLSSARQAHRALCPRSGEHKQATVGTSRRCLYLHRCYREGRRELALSSRERLARALRTSLVEMLGEVERERGSDKAERNHTSCYPPPRYVRTEAAALSFGRKSAVFAHSTSDGLPTFAVRSEALDAACVEHLMSLSRRF